MLSTKPFSSASAAKEYYSHGDYYGSEGKGIWFGEGAKELGFSGEFSAKSDKAFKNILHGKPPNGQVLGKRTKEGIQHRPGLDLTFSCPKSFSIQMLLYAGKEERAALEKAMMNAVTETLSYIERRGYVMTRKHGVKEKLNKLIFATFSHTTNRNLEPQAHVHCFLANVAKCKDGKFRSIIYDKIFENLKFLGQVFRNELALELKKLGYEIETKILSDGSRSFELTNIHPKLIKEFSTRRQEILEICKLLNITSKEGRDRIVITSRKAKRSVKREDLLNAWRAVEHKVMKEIKKENPGDGMRAKSKATSFDKPTGSGNIRTNNKTYGQAYEKIDIKQIYRVLYDRLPVLLPEFGFVKRGGCYVSTTGQKIDGSTGKKGKIYVYANNPGTLVDYTRGNKSMWSYVQERQNFSSNSEVFKYLSGMAGFNNASMGKLDPRKPVTLKKNEEIKPDKPAVDSKTWETVYKYSIEKIKIPNNQVSKYLEQDRGYSKETINKMGIGYIPSKRELESYLVAARVPQSQIAEVKKALGYIGCTHKMVMPYHDKTGQIIGLAARNIKYIPGPGPGKYMYSKGLAKNSTLLNIHEIKPSQEIIIVEGMLDCLHARAQGIKNVVAVGGTGFSSKQAELINDLTNKITVCMDSDKAGQEASEKIVSLIHEKNPEAQIKLVTLPEGIKDLDELLNVRGVEKAIEVIATAELKENVNLKKEDKQIDQQALNEILDTDDGTAQALSGMDLAKLCVEDITHHKSVFEEEELHNKMIKYSLGEFSIKEMQSKTKELEKAGILLVGEEGLTTKALLDKEMQILKFAKDGLGQVKPILNEKYFKTRCAAFEKREQSKNANFKMNSQQRKALKHIITSKDKVVGIVGLPGVGKSTVLNAVRDISGNKIINILGLSEEKFQGIAPTASAAKTLKDSAKIESNTLHSFLGKYQGYIEDRGTKESLRAMRCLFKKVIIFLDESSLVPTRLMHRLLKLQHKFGFRVVMTGDTKQLGAVEAGKPFEQILSVIPHVKLTKIIRQKDQEHIEAIVASSAGDINTAFSIHKDKIFSIRDENSKEGDDEYTKEGDDKNTKEGDDKNTKEREDIKDLVRHTVNFYLQGNLKRRENTLLISPTRSLRDSINKEISTELRKANILQGKIEEFTALRQKDMSMADYRFAPSFRVGDTIRFHAAHKKNDIENGDYYIVIKANKITNTIILEREEKQIRYCLKKDVNYENKFEVFTSLKLELQEGLKIRFTKNNKEFGLINSETAIIEKLDKDNIALKLEDGNVKNIPKSQLKHIDYGYCMTVHSSQGKTFESTIAAISTNKWLNNQKSWLVTLSRHKSEFTAVVQDKEQLKSYLMKNKGDELSAMEVMGIKPDNEKILRPDLNKDKMNTIKDLQIQI